MSEYKKTQFCIKGITNTQFQGYTDGDTWNGFACPYFERTVAEQILNNAAKHGISWLYNYEYDAFIVRSISDPDGYAPEEFQGHMIAIDGKETRVYGIGAYTWMWRFCN
ncbi:MAG: hypothetical protein ABI690_34075 [Chloroflexota bacterium]